MYTKHIIIISLLILYILLQLWVCVSCLVSSFAAPAPSQNPQLYLDIIDMAAISRMSPQQLEVLAEGLAAEEIMRLVSLMQTFNC